MNVGHRHLVMYESVFSLYPVFIRWRKIQTHTGLFLRKSAYIVASIATGYRLDGRGVGVLVPVGARFFSSPQLPDRFWGSNTSYPMGTGHDFPGSKAAGA
jgi:hypothetical protein